jgi:hypothetical protein
MMWEEEVVVEEGREVSRELKAQLTEISARMG